MDQWQSKEMENKNYEMKEPHTHLDIVANFENVFRVHFYRFFFCYPACCVILCDV